MTGIAQLIRAYCLDPHDYWEGIYVRQADKLTKKRDVATRVYSRSAEDVVDTVIEAAAQRRADGGKPTLCVTGLGGSGSNWLVAMLAGHDAITNAGEVYFAKPFLESLAGHSSDDQAMAIDAVHLLHAWPADADAFGRIPANSAAGVPSTLDLKALDPQVRAIYLHRDPRDQVLSVTFRKQAYREYSAGAVDDTEYLVRMARRNANEFAKYAAAASSIDASVSYEELRDDPRPALRSLFDLAGVAASDETIESIAYEHDADNIRAGKSSQTGNLDEGGVARGWRSHTPEIDLRIIHSELIAATSGLGYRLGVCVDGPSSSLASGTAPSVGAGRVYRWARDGSWQELSADGATTLAPPAPLLLRFGVDDGADVGAVDDASSFSALCLASNRHVTDSVVERLRAWTTLESLDLARTKVTDASLDVVGDMAALRAVSLWDCSISDEALDALAARNPRLQMVTPRGELRVGAEVAAG